MSDLIRAARQILKDLQYAGLTHLPHIELPPRVAKENLSDRTQERPPQQENRPVRSFQAPVRRESAPQPIAPVHAAALNVEKNLDTLAVRETKLAQLQACVAGCTKCPTLARTRTQTVFGVGDALARIMFIGEAPGADEDKTGEPFVGKAGQLLTKIIEACGWTRSEIYICNILRCRPPENRLPTETEANHCREYLDGQIAIVDPDYIICWGSCASQNLLRTKDSIGKMRQKFYQYGRARVLCTYHPSYLLRNPAARKPVWEDMKFFMAEIGHTPPAR
ncbi:uracil-DNA glycosylase [Planctomicrobium sp. SH668]|uniref:uracil-DNA glycosylase n=1 Tax=Planctomicrobium sp. SH668 TaxID=3448126 RepID=UPI003F5CAF3E